MNLSEILAEIDEKYPNALSSDSKVRKVDKLQKKIFRTVVKRTVTFPIDVIKGVYIYPLSISPTKIREVLVDGKKCDYRQIEGYALSKFYYILDNHIGVYPTPTEDKASGILLFHYQEPTTISVVDLSQTPDLDDDFHDLLVYGVCKELAEIDQRFDISNGFIQQFKQELELYFEANQDTSPAQIQEESWW